MADAVADDEEVLAVLVEDVFAVVASVEEVALVEVEEVLELEVTCLLLPFWTGTLLFLSLVFALDSTSANPDVVAASAASVVVATAVELAEVG